MLGYTFNTEASARAARNSCSDALLPSPRSETQQWCDYEYDAQGFWFIRYDNSMAAVLGPPVQLLLTPPSSPFV